MNQLVRKIESAQVPGNPGTFCPGEYICPGSPGFKGVGAKLIEALKGYTISAASPVQVHFFLGEKDEANNLPTELMTDSCEELEFWTLYQLLSWPSSKVLDALPSGSQLGCRVGFCDGARAVRVQIDWENGHNIGFRPSEPGWAWNAGTIFAVCEHS